MWGEQYKGDANALPTVNEIVDGLVEWHVMQMEVIMKGLGVKTNRKDLLSYRKTM